MKNLLLTMCASALALSASAETTVFLMEGTHIARVNTAADAKIVTVPAGTILTNKPTEPKCASDITLNKTMMSDEVEIAEDRIRKSDNSFITAEPTYYTRCGFIDWRANQVLKFTPAAGLTVTSIKVKGNKVGNEGAFDVVTGVENDALVVLGSSKAAADTSAVWTGTIDKAFHVKPTKNIQAMYIEVVTEGTSTQVAAPVSDAKYPLVGENQKIALTSATEGARIYYTIDTEFTGKANAVDINAATLYTEPFTLEKDAVVRAVAVKDGMTNSFPTYNEYFVVPDYEKVANFNFGDPASLVDLENKPVATLVLNNLFKHTDAKDGGFDKTLHSNIEGLVFDPETETLFQMTSGAGTITSSSSFGGCTEFRPAQNSTFGFTAPLDYFVSGVLIISGYTSKGVALKDGIAGQFAPSPVHAAYYVYRNNDNSVEAPEFVATGSKQYVDGAYVFLTPVNGMGGVEDITVDAGAPVEYFNLQGVRVANPTNGLFIKRQGKKVTKVIL